MTKQFWLIAFLGVFLATSLPVLAAEHGEKKEEKKEEKGEKKEGEAETPLDRYVQLDPIIIPVIQRDGLQQVISMVVVIEAKSASLAQDVRDKKPKLADAFLSDMYGTFSRPSNMNDGVVKISELKTRMVQIAAEILGPDVVQDVLLQVLQQRPA